MTPVRIINAPQGFDYYKVCDPTGVCRVARGWQEAQRIMKEKVGLNASKLPSSQRHLRKKRARKPARPQLPSEFIGPHPANCS